MRSRKYHNIQQHSRVALVIGCDDEVTVQCEGFADVLDGAERARCVAAYIEQYPDGRQRAQDPEIAHVRVRPDWARYSDHFRHFHPCRRAGSAASDRMRLRPALGTRSQAAGPRQAAASPAFTTRLGSAGVDSRATRIARDPRLRPPWSVCVSSFAAPRGCCDVPYSARSPERMIGGGLRDDGRDRKP